MPLHPDALCISVSQSLKRFDCSVLRTLSSSLSVGQWEYQQSPDEPCSFETALVLLHDYLKQCDRPLHLIGHGISGTLAILYARRYPNRVRSLTLLSVGAHPAIDWQAHYYIHRQLLNCSRSFVLTQVVTNLFGSQSKSMTQRLVSVLERDLDTSVSPHSLIRRTSIPPGGVPVPMFIGRGEYDVVIDPHEFEQWKSWLKVGDRLWECPDGRHFFHHSHASKTAEQILDFWQVVSLRPLPSSLTQR
ncbi:MAG: alpha/beta fold hydrolase [Elainellaceae cyanobacterium]